MGSWGITERESDYGLDLLGTIVATQLKAVDFATFNVADTLTISRLAAKLLPLPGVPRNRPLGFLSRGTFQRMGKTRREKPRGRLKAVFGGR